MECASAPMLQATVGAAESASCWERSLDLLWWTKAWNGSKIRISSAHVAPYVIATWRQHIVVLNDLNIPATSCHVV